MRRNIIWLALIVLVLFGLASAYWFGIVLTVPRATDSKPSDSDVDVIEFKIVEAFIERYSVDITDATIVIKAHTRMELVIPWVVERIGFSPSFEGYTQPYVASVNPSSGLGKQYISEPRYYPSYNPSYIGVLRIWVDDQTFAPLERYGSSFYDTYWPLYSDFSPENPRPENPRIGNPNNFDVTAHYQIKATYYVVWVKA